MSNSLRRRPRRQPDLARRAALLAMLAAAGGVGCDIRAPSVPFAYTLLDGRRGNSAGLRGSVVLVNFWATSCATCVREMPGLVATHRRFRARGFELLAVAMRHDAPAAVADFAERRALPFGVAIDNTGRIAQAFPDLQATPTSYLLDKRGAIVERHVGAPDFGALHARIEALLAEPAAGA